MVVGTAAIPSGSAHVLRQGINKMIRLDLVSPSAKWLSLEYWAADFLASPDA